jgi:hypothetical protein
MSWRYLGGAGCRFMLVNGGGGVTVFTGLGYVYRVSTVIVETLYRCKSANDQLPNSFRTLAR